MSCPRILLLLYYLKPSYNLHPQIHTHLYLLDTESQKTFSFIELSPQKKYQYLKKTQSNYPVTIPPPHNEQYPSPGLQVTQNSLPSTINILMTDGATINKAKWLNETAVFISFNYKLHFKVEFIYLNLMYGKKGRDFDAFDFSISL